MLKYSIVFFSLFISSCYSSQKGSTDDASVDIIDGLVDSDNNGISDYVEGTGDIDGDTLPDYLDPDNDGDGILDVDEIGGNPPYPTDHDFDGIPDYMDTDSDGDTIPDIIEGEVDADNDTIPSFLDRDSDGDGILDEEEFMGCNGDSETAVDSDGDGNPDFLDVDSDGDGLIDSLEAEIFTSRCIQDTDGDGFDDLVEWAHPSADPSDGSSTLGDDFYVVLPPGSLVEERFLTFVTQITMVDIFFLIDTTASMYDEMDRIRATLLSTIIPNIASSIPDPWYGVGWFADFWYGDYGVGPDLAFELIQGMTNDPSQAHEALHALPECIGADLPESQVEALYQTATGEGLEPWVLPYPCSEGIGAPCFRPGSLPVILLFTDAPMHNGPPGTTADDYRGIEPPPHGWSEAVEALNAIGARVIGLDSEGEESRDAYNDLDAAARATHAVDFEENTLVFDIGSGGEHLDTSVVTSIEILMTHSPFDVDTYVVDVPDLYTEPGWEEVDATCFIKSRTAQPGWIPPPGYTYDEAVAFHDDSTFYSVIPGTQLTFKIEFGNYSDEYHHCYDGDSIPRAFLAKIIARAGGAAQMHERIVVIVVP